MLICKPSQDFLVLSLGHYRNEQVFPIQDLQRILPHAERLQLAASAGTPRSRRS